MHETAIEAQWEPDPDRSRHAAGSLDSNNSESAVVRELRQRSGTVDADVGPAQDRPSTPPQKQVMRVRGGEKDAATLGQDPCRR